jgi:hypothetical protein
LLFVVADAAGSLDILVSSPALPISLVPAGVSPVVTDVTPAAAVAGVTPEVEVVSGTEVAALRSTRFLFGCLCWGTYNEPTEVSNKE